MLASASADGHCATRRRDSWINPQWELRSRLLPSLSSHFCKLGEGNLDNLNRVSALFEPAIASFNLSWPVISGRTSLSQFGNWRSFTWKNFPVDNGALGGIEWSLDEAGWQVRIWKYMCSRLSVAEDLWRIGSEWFGLMHCPWSTKFSGRLPFSSFSSLDVLTLAPMQLLAYTALSLKLRFPLGSEVFFQGWHNNILQFDLQTKCAPLTLSKWVSEMKNMKQGFKRNPLII